MIVCRKTPQGACRPPGPGLWSRPPGPAWASGLCPPRLSRMPHEPLLTPRRNLNPPAARGS